MVVYRILDVQQVCYSVELFVFVDDPVEKVIEVRTENLLKPRHLEGNRSLS